MLVKPPHSGILGDNHRPAAGRTAGPRMHVGVNVHIDSSPSIAGSALAGKQKALEIDFRNMDLKDALNDILLGLGSDDDCEYVLDRLIGQPELARANTFYTDETRPITHSEVKKSKRGTVDRYRSRRVDCDDPRASLLEADDREPIYSWEEFSLDADGAKTRSQVEVEAESESPRPISNIAALCGELACRLLDDPRKLFNDGQRGGEPIKKQRLDLFNKAWDKLHELDPNALSSECYHPAHTESIILARIMQQKPIGCLKADSFYWKSVGKAWHRMIRSDSIINPVELRAMVDSDPAFLVELVKKPIELRMLRAALNQDPDLLCAADWLRPTSTQETPLSAALSSTNPEQVQIVQYLLQKLKPSEFAYRDPKTGDTLLHVAVDYEHVPTTDLVLDKLDQLSKSKRRAVHKPNRKGRRPLSIAILRDNEAIGKKLLKSGCPMPIMGLGVPPTWNLSDTRVPSYRIRKQISMGRFLPLAIGLTMGAASTVAIVTAIALFAAGLISFFPGVVITVIVCCFVWLAAVEIFRLQKRN